ncbi:MAG: hypothetical protein ACT6TH_09775 [Brevundimonas sp.]|uniref:hypothetical protein n=1 Tax=Brevundimonas sp. TaxID=1871086 RepID=UPI004033FDFD
MSWMANGGPGGVVLRFMIDALLVLAFFAVLSAGATAVHWIVTQCEAAHVDHNVILMLKGRWSRSMERASWLRRLC